jgi:hypothetical protein
VPNLQAEARHVAEEVMEGVNGSASPATSSTTETPRSPIPSTDDQRKSPPAASRRPVPFRTSSRSHKARSSKDTNQGQGRAEGLELDSVKGDNFEQERSDEQEKSQKGSAIRPDRGIGGEMGDRNERTDITDSENAAFDGHHHRSGTVVRSLNTKGQKMPVLATNNSNTKDFEDERTPTSRGSFWGKE